MLAFNHIGSLGRLGNQMFEYATLRGIAAKHGYDFMIPPPENGGIENIVYIVALSYHQIEKKVCMSVESFKNHTFISLRDCIRIALMM